MERKDPRVHQKTVRLNRFLAMAGLGSRRKMDSLISSGVVTVNGETVSSLGVQVHPGRDRVTVDGREVIVAERNVYVLLNKPKDTITTLSDERGRQTILDFVRVKQRIFPVGRLDRNTTGVLILTNDGMLAQSLLHPSFEVERVYMVTLAEPLGHDEQRKLKKGVQLEDGPAHVSGLEYADKDRKKVYVTLREGRNREVRRMFEAVGHDVRQLDRVAYAGLTARGLRRGQWRFLSRQEVQYLSELSNEAAKRSPRKQARTRR